MTEYSVIDIHSHILPDLDDGVKTASEMFLVLESAWRQGIRKMIATPHYPSHADRTESGEEDSSRYRDMFDLAKKTALEIHPEFQLYAGHEIYWSDGILEALKEKKALTLAKSRYVLLEFHPETEYSIIYRGVKEMIQEGYLPILAHVERYSVLWRSKDRMREMEQMGCYFQMNLSSLSGNRFRPSVRYNRNMVREGWIQFMGTDTHGMNFRPIEIKDAVKWIYQHCGAEDAGQMLYKNAERILENRLLS